jgi:transcriptional regulator with XRE-family HTH domain
MTRCTLLGTCRRGSTARVCEPQRRSEAGGNSVTAPCQYRRMPTLRERPKGLRVQAERRRTIERHRRWAVQLRWPSPPGKGWLTEVRVASGLSAGEVALRMAVSRSAVSYAEASERQGTIQLDVLRRYADAVDADVHYVLVPRASVLLPVDSEGRRRRNALRLRSRSTAAAASVRVHQGERTV